MDVQGFDIVVVGVIEQPLTAVVIVSDVETEVHRGGSWEGRMDVEWGRSRANQNHSMSRSPGRQTETQQCHCLPPL